ASQPDIPDERVVVQQLLEVGRDVRDGIDRAHSAIIGWKSSSKQALSESKGGAKGLAPPLLGTASVRASSCRGSGALPTSESRSGGEVRSSGPCYRLFR